MATRAEVAITMALFLGILSLGWLYAYKEGILEWK